jgi:hypothetical protein
MYSRTDGPTLSCKEVLTVKRSFAAIVVLLASLLFAQSLQAFEFGIRAGRFNDLKENMIGVEVAFNVGPLVFNPNFEYVLIDELDLMSLNADFLYPFARGGRTTPYLGLGVGVMRFEASGFGSTDEWLGNAIAGVAFGAGRVKPYVQIKHFRFLEETAAHDTMLTIGVRF